MFNRVYVFFLQTTDIFISFLASLDLFSIIVVFTILLVVIKTIFDLIFSFIKNIFSRYMGESLKFEDLVIKKLCTNLKATAKVYEDLYVYNRHTQLLSRLDLVIVSERGIVALKIEDWYADRIVDDTDVSGEMVLHVGNKKVSKPSPLSEIRRLAEVLASSLETNHEIYSIVGFSGMADSIETNARNILIGEHDIVQKVMTYYAGNEIIYTQVQLEQIINFLDFLQAKVTNRMKHYKAEYPKAI